MLRGRLLIRFTALISSTGNDNCSIVRFKSLRRVGNAALAILCLTYSVSCLAASSPVVSSGQVLMEPYTFKMARVVVHEMADAAALDLVEKRMVTDQVVLTVNYDIESLEDPEIRKKYKNKLKKDWYGRIAPKPAHGTENLDRPSSSGRKISVIVHRASRW